MRVITGSAKGHKLKAPARLGLRPTPSRVKEALFSSLAARIPEATVLDLFSGTGAFAIETLSRGAASAVLVEKDPRAAGLIKQNLEKTHLTSRARLLQLDVRQALERLEKEKASFSFIFADPPYHESPIHVKRGEKNNLSWAGYLLASSTLHALLQEDGVLLVEYFKKEQPAESPYFEFMRDFRFGDTIVGVWRKK